MDPLVLPDDLPRPVDDGAADHLLEAVLPSLPLRATSGDSVDLSVFGGRTIVYAYPRTGVPGEDPLVPDWDEIPGARGCTPESCGFRDHFTDLIEAGAAGVYGLSTQESDYQREAAQRLSLPFPILSDAELELTGALRLPTFEAAGQTLLRRLTLVVRDGSVEKLWYPVFPPDRHAAEVLDWLRANPASGTG